MLAKPLYSSPISGGKAQAQFHISYGQPAKNQLVFVNRGEKLDTTSYCSGCLNVSSGQVVTCDHCCIRSFCSNCLDITQMKEMTKGSGPNGEDKPFVCPHCHKMGSGQVKHHQTEQYPYRYIESQTTRSLWPACDSSPIAVISIRAFTVDEFDSPATIIYHHLASSLKGNAYLIDLDFDFADEGARNNYRDRIDVVANELESGFLSHIQRVMLIICTGGASVDEGEHFGQMMENLLPGRLLETIEGKGGKKVCVLTHCKDLLKLRESVEQLKLFSLSKPFNDVLALTPVTAKPAFANKFLCEFAQQYFVHHKHHLSQTLVSCPEFGAHSGIVHLTDDKQTRYEWSHLTVRPLGQPIPLQCPVCGFLKTLVPFRSTNRKEAMYNDPSDDVKIVCSRKANCGYYVVIPGWRKEDVGNPLPVDLNSKDGVWLYGPFRTPSPGPTTRITLCS